MPHGGSVRRGFFRSAERNWAAPRGLKRATGELVRWRSGDRMRRRVWGARRVNVWIPGALARRRGGVWRSGDGLGGGNRSALGGARWRWPGWSGTRGYAGDGRSVPGIGLRHRRRRARGGADFRCSSARARARGRVRWWHGRGAGRSGRGRSRARPCRFCGCGAHARCGMPLGGGALGPRRGGR